MNCDNKGPHQRVGGFIEVGPLFYTFGAHHDHETNRSLDYGAAFSIRVTSGFPEHVYNNFDVTLPRAAFYALVERLQLEVQAMQADEAAQSDAEQDMEKEEHESLASTANT